MKLTELSSFGMRLDVQILFRLRAFNLAIGLGWSLCCIIILMLNFFVADAIKDAQERGKEISRQKGTAKFIDLQVELGPLQDSSRADR